MQSIVNIEILFQGADNCRSQTEKTKLKLEVGNKVLILIQILSTSRTKIVNVHFDQCFMFFMIDEFGIKFLLFLRKL